MRALLHSADPPSSPPPPPQPAAISIDSDMVVILASLLCALICVAGLALVARCACRRPRRSATSTSATTAPAPTAPAPAPKGLKKKAIDALPTVSFAAGRKQAAAECAICLAEFAAGEELRVLPHCGHGFHVACIDTWLGAHATCPSCRATVGTPPPSTLFLPGRCRRCGEVGDVATLDFSSSTANDAPT